MQKIDSACDNCNLVDAKNKDAHVALACYEAQNNDLSDISNDEFLIEADEPFIEDDEIDSFQKHTKGIGSKLPNKMSFDGKCFLKSGQGIQNPIQICVRPKHEGQTRNEDMKFVKAETLITSESSTSSSAIDQV